MGVVDIRSPQTAFGQLATSEETPQIQIEAIYGLTDEHETFTATGGSATASDSMFVCQTGTSVGGYGVIRSLRDARYRPGQGTVSRFTAMFTSPGIALSVQGAGLFTSENDLIFGYNGTSFGVRRRTGGFLEIRRLTITNPAGGAETLTVTLNGTPTDVSLTAGTAAHNAWQVANTVFTGWNAYQNGSTVTFVATSYGSRSGSYSASSTGVATGSFDQVRAGAAPSDNWTAQSDWSEDTADWFDPTKLNVFQIRYQYLGAGEIEYAIENRRTGKFVVVHRDKFAGTATSTSLTNPTFKVGWFAASLGSSGTNLTVSGASAYVGTEGRIVPFRKPRAVNSEKSGISSTLTNVVTIRNRATFASAINYREVWPAHLSVGFDGTGAAPVLLKVIINAALPGSGGAADEPNYTYADETNSCVEYDTSAETVTGGTLVAGGGASKNGQFDLRLGDLEINLSRTESITVAVSTSTGSVTANATLTWYED